MRASIFVLLMALPVAGFAQTPRDLAQLSFGSDVPAMVSQAPSAPTVGAATGLDLARLSGGAGQVVSHTSTTHFAAASSFTGADIARLRGDGVAPIGLDTVGVRVVTVDHPHG